MTESDLRTLLKDADNQASGYPELVKRRFVFLIDGFRLNQRIASELHKMIDGYTFSTKDGAETLAFNLASGRSISITAHPDGTATYRYPCGQVVQLG